MTLEYGAKSLELNNDSISVVALVLLFIKLALFELRQVSSRLSGVDDDIDRLFDDDEL